MTTTENSATASTGNSLQPHESSSSDSLNNDGSAYSADCSATSDNDDTATNNNNNNNSSNGNSSSLHSKDRKTKGAAAVTATSKASKNIDPQIDLSLVGHIRINDHKLPLYHHLLHHMLRPKGSNNNNKRNNDNNSDDACSNQSTNDQSDQLIHDNNLPTVESYYQLMETVQPYFNALGVPYTETINANKSRCSSERDDDSTDLDTKPMARTTDEKDADNISSTVALSVAMAKSNDYGQEWQAEDVVPSVALSSNNANNKNHARLVTDTSSSNKTNSADSNPSTNGNSGSNQGSSGSGNDARHNSNTTSSNINATNCDESPITSDAAAANKHSHEEKILHKKRKRIEMRREYEAQQQLDSSEGSREVDYRSDILQPGQPVSLDTALELCHTARVVAQAVPPFLVVHTNAAYTRLTGFDSHVVVGFPVTDLFTLLTSDQTTSVYSGYGLQRLIASSGYGRAHTLGISMKPVLTTAQGTDTSASGVSEARRYKSCRVVIVPVVSTTDLLDISYINNQNEHLQPSPTDVEHADEPGKKKTKLCVTHYIIQIYEASEDSLSISSEPAYPARRHHAASSVRIDAVDDLSVSGTSSTNTNDPAVAAIG